VAESTGAADSSWNTLDAEVFVRTSSCLSRSMWYFIQSKKITLPMTQTTRMKV